MSKPVGSKKAAISLVLGLYRKANFHPSCCPDMEREEIKNTLGKALRGLGVSEEDLHFNPYKRRDQ